MSSGTDEDQVMEPELRYPPIADYGLISDGHCVALVSTAGSVDWCCMPRIDADSDFGRLLDWDRGGFWSIAPREPYTSSQRYEANTLVLVTEFRTSQGAVKLYDCFALSDGPADQSLHLRVLEGLTGDVDVRLTLAPRFDYGAIIPCMHQHAQHLYAAWGSNQGMLIYSDVALQEDGDGTLGAALKVAAGQRVYFSIRSVPPERLNEPTFSPPESSDYLQRQLGDTLQWWRRWIESLRTWCRFDAQTVRSALTLKGLAFERTGAIAAAATTSLPEGIGGERNWDYRYSWVRDSVFTVHALHAMGFTQEADRFAAFIERSAAGSAAQLQIMYGVDGKRRLTEVELTGLEGYRQSRPVRIGNQAAEQLQLDTVGELLELAWTRHCHGSEISPRHWRFLVDVVNMAAERWHEPDHGFWEVRSDPRHFVFSKALCWCALDRGIRLAEHRGFDVPAHWQQCRDDIQTAVDNDGYDAERGIFRQAFGDTYLDCSLLLLPQYSWVGYNDPRMVRTIDAICTTLETQGLLHRYNGPDGLAGSEGIFIPCTFWLVSCLARLPGRLDSAWSYYRRAVACANAVGLFSEEYDPQAQRMLGNFPQALTHVSQIEARLALEGEANLPSPQQDDRKP